MTRRSVKSTNAVTLVEFLICLGIACFVLAILFPAFGAARAKAVSASCVNTERQVYVAWKSYLQDNDDLIAVSDYHNYTNVAKHYLGVEQLMCPGIYPASACSGIPGFCGYAMNTQLKHPERKIDTIVNPAMTVGWTEQAPGMFDCPTWVPHVVGSDRVIPVGNNRHFNGSNILFVDGHTRWYSSVPEPYVKWIPGASPSFP